MIDEGVRPTLLLFAAGEERVITMALLGKRVVRTDAATRRSTMRELSAELKALRLHGMAGAWDDLVAQGS